VLRTVADLEEIGRLSIDVPGILGLAVSPDGMLLACATSNGTVILWDTTSSEIIRRIDLHGAAQAVTISDDGTLVAAAWDHAIGIWSIQGEHPVATCDLTIKGIYALAFDHRGSRLAQTGADGKVRIWDLDAPQRP
jgi:WD40 repeat protein